MKELSSYQWAIVLLPIISFYSFLFFLIIGSFQRKIDFKSAILEKRSKELKFSASRLVLILAVFCVSLISVLATSFMFYAHFGSEKNVDLSSLAALLTAVGISGILPYASNLILKK